MKRSPGRRVPGSADGYVLAIRAMLGQQVSVSAARTLAGRLVARCGQPLPESLVEPERGLTHLFPELGAVAEIRAADLAMPAARREALCNLARGLTGGGIDLDPGSDREEAGRMLLALRGVGPWKASYVAMRALGDPDAFLPTDLGVRRAVAGLGGGSDLASVTALARRWRPWRAYATQHLWASL